EKPSFGDNLTYLFQYQLGYMYWRYFMWNFVGRQDDIQGKQDNHGNWLSGINAVDEIHLGLPQENLPSDVENNNARNTYYFLPLILGLIGLFFIAERDKKMFWVMTVFFLLTGLAIQVYTNVRPFEPRERDYSVVGSFYVFSMWIGFSLFAIYTFIQKYLSAKNASIIATVITLLACPLLLATQNWDDHDRSNRYTAQSMAKVYLDSCQENAILFTIGDNDTFALWYAQDIEGHRTDVRTLNTSLFNTDWYIDQMKRKAYKSDPIPSQLTHEQYRYGTRTYVPYQPVTRDTMMIKDFMNFISSDDPKHKMRFALEVDGMDTSKYPEQYLNLNYFPTKSVRIPVDKEAVVKNGIVEQKDADKIVPYIDIQFKGNALYKNRILMLDIIANNNWERPIYFTGGSYGDDDFLWMKDYLELDGLGYKLVPIRTPQDKRNPYDLGRIDSEKLYNKVMAWEWGNSGDPEIYHDPETRKNGITYRSNMARLVEKLIYEKKFDKAEKVLDLGMEKMPIDKFEYYTLVEPFIAGYYAIDKKDKGRKYYKQMSNKYKENLEYYKTLDILTQKYYGEEIIADLERYKALVEILSEHKDDKIKTEEIDKIIGYVGDFKKVLTDFDYNVSLEFFLEDLYVAGKKETAHKVFYNSIEEYQYRLSNVSQLEPKEQLEFQDNIMRDLEDYRMLVALPLIFKDKELFEKEMDVYNDYVNKFMHFMPEEEPQDSLPE
ncbi:MAG: hypothetical protein HRT68_09880, partial [Flavobacteriaceae bacterium]|nr:hypothetical protein [Flavobacteriaceae bacterium]